MNGNRYILLIDMDSVIADWYGHLLSIYRARYPDRPYVEPKDVTTFWVEDLYPEEHRDDVTAIVREIGFYRDLPMMPGALECLKDMENNCTHFLDPFLCSSPEVEYTGMQCHSEKAAWVEKHLGSWWTRRLILTKDKTLVRGNFLIDDKPEIKGVMIPTWARLVYTHPYNKHLENEGHFTWADWPEFRDILKPEVVVEIPKKSKHIYTGPGQDQISDEPFRLLLPTGISSGKKVA